jgi:hypothetical protein
MPEFAPNTGNPAGAGGHFTEGPPRDMTLPSEAVGDMIQAEAPQTPVDMTETPEALPTPQDNEGEDDYDDVWAVQAAGGRTGAIITSPSQAPKNEGPAETSASANAAELNSDDELGPDEEWQYVWVGGETIPGTDETVGARQERIKVKKQSPEEQSPQELSRPSEPQPTPVAPGRPVRESRSSRGPGAPRAPRGQRRQAPTARGPRPLEVARAKAAGRNTLNGRQEIEHVRPRTVTYGEADADGRVKVGRQYEAEGTRLSFANITNPTIIYVKGGNTYYLPEGATGPIYDMNQSHNNRSLVGRASTINPQNKFTLGQGEAILDSHERDGVQEMNLGVVTAVLTCDGFTRGEPRTKEGEDPNNVYDRFDQYDSFIEDLRGGIPNETLLPAHPEDAVSDDEAVRSILPALELDLSNPDGSIKNYLVEQGINNPSKSQVKHARELLGLDEDKIIELRGKSGRYAAIAREVPADLMEEMDVQDITSLRDKVKGSATEVAQSAFPRLKRSGEKTKTDEGRLARMRAVARGAVFFAQSSEEDNETAELWVMKGKEAQKESIELWLDKNGYSSGKSNRQLMRRHIEAQLEASEALTSQWKNAKKDEGEVLFSEPPEAIRALLKKK